MTLTIEEDLIELLRFSCRFPGLQIKELVLTQQCFNRLVNEYGARAVNFLQDNGSFKFPGPLGYVILRGQNDN